METNLSHYLTVGVASVFPGLRRTIGILGLLGMIIGGLMVYRGNAPEPIVVNATPSCERSVWQVQSAFLPPPVWGNYVKSIGKDRPSFYVQEAKGNGWCLVKKDEQITIINNIYVQRWFEVPSKFGDRIQALASSQNPEPRPLYLLGLVFGCVGTGLLFCIWLPATILAAVGRRLLSDVKEEPL